MPKKMLILSQKLRRLNKKKIIGFVFAIFGISFIILPFFLVPYINTEKIWTSKEWFFEPWLYRDSFSLPQNDLILNKYDVKAFNYYPLYGSESVLFTHLATNIVYNFTVNFTVAEYSMKTTFQMKPGEYSVRFTRGLFHYELWEHGIIPPGLELHVYLGIEIIAVFLILISLKYFRNSTILTSENLLKPKNVN
ncbi:MAG: hypothetical protein ACFFBH_14805 [Promethearchaeota archaeon]